jgi:hypothetical protein
VVGGCCAGFSSSMLLMLREGALLAKEKAKNPARRKFMPVYSMN